MREIVLDTETTGFDPLRGDKLVEIGCVEIFNRIKTGKSFQAYIHPGREVPEAAIAVHGITNEFLKDKPRFEAVVDAFLEFIGDSPLVIHNAEFDMKFINAELRASGKPGVEDHRVFCTLKAARKKFPGAQASLDALCKRFGVDTTARTKHGALLDAELLADMYLELMGGSQVKLELDTIVVSETTISLEGLSKKEVRPARPFEPTAEELAAHAAFIEKLKNPIWKTLN